MAAITQSTMEAIAGSGKSVIPTTAGVPNSGVIASFRFTETDGSGFLDDVTKTRVAATGAGTVTVGGAGGVTLSGIKQIKAPTPLNVALPFTIIMLATIPVPAAGARRQQLIQVGDYSATGFSEYIEVAADVANGDKIAPAFVGSKNGVAQASPYGYRRPLVGSYGNLVAYVIRSQASSIFRFEQRASDLSARGQATFVLSELQGGGAKNPNLIVSVGATQAAQGDMPISIDAFTVAQTYWNEQTIRAWIKAVTPLANIRGHY